MRAQFVLSEMAIGLRRNLTMTVAVIVTTSISLALFGAGLLLREQVNEMKTYWYDKVEVSIFLADGITPAQRDAINTDLNAAPEVKTVFYESKQEAFQRFQEQFRDSPELVRNVSPEVLPESFRVKLEDPTQYAVLAGTFATRAGVEQVVDQRRVLDRLFRVLNGFRDAALFIALLQLLAATLLISNTIRLAAFSRRRETGIMRLVGASNLYIQLPFLLEGALAGLTGGLVAAGVLVAIKELVIDERLRTVFTLTEFIGYDEVVPVILRIVLVGVVLSALASFLTLRKYLRV